MTVTLRYVGNFFELGYDHHPNAPLLRACRGKRTRERKREVLAYLRAGKTYIASPGIDRDFFDKRRRADTRSLMTDGVYVWPELLRYYVDEHDVELPQDFEAHMSANGWRPPGSVDITQLALPESQR
jgi:hypothetical protein